MEMGAPRVVPSRVSGRRRHKAVMPWRFQPGFVRKQVKNAGAPSGGGGGVPLGGSGAKGSRLAAAGSSGKRSMDGQQDHQTRRFTRNAIAKGSDAEKEESGGKSCSGGQPDHQTRRFTRSATAKDSDAEKEESGGKSSSGGQRDHQTMRFTRSATARGSDAEKQESGGKSSSGDQPDHQTMRFTRSATVKGSDAEKQESGGKSSSGGQRDHQTMRFTRITTAMGSDAEKQESGSRRGVKGRGDLDKPCRNGSPEGSELENLGNFSAGTTAAEECSLGKSCSNGCPEGSELNNSGNGSAGTTTAEDCCLGRSNCDGTSGDTDLRDAGGCASIDAADRTACNPEEGRRNAGVEKCSSEGSKKSCVKGSESKSNVGSAADCTSAKNGGGKGGGSVQDSDAASKGCGLAGPGSNGNGTNCRKGQKTVVPWRFQIGYKRSFSKAFCSHSGSFGSFGTPEHRAQGSSSRCSPATRSTVRCYASAHSSVRVSAMSDFSSVKGQKETSTSYKRKAYEDDHNQVMPSEGAVLARENIMQYLQDFRHIYKDLLDKDEDRADLQAYRIFRGKSSVECDDKKYIGDVPGIHVGDVFHLRVELCIAGLHRPHRVGVDHIMAEDGTCIATSIVAYARSSDVKNNFDVLVYAGSMVATANQKIQGTNLALKKSMDTKTPVRVIHGFKIHPSVKKKLPTYIYGGLYQVEKYWREKEKEDSYAYMFRLRRMADQKHLDIQEILKSRKSEPNDCIIMEDLSNGLERIPISVVNTISDEYPMPFQYISRLQYPCNYQPAPPAGCGCVGGCSDSMKCACAVKNGGEIPFNERGCILKAKPLVYECGPSCKCPPTCHNRVGQKGTKFRLQVFKTKLMGWGVRTLDFIPCGSFVCEYIGEVLEEEEAQGRMTDEYLFAIGHNYYDETLWEGLSRSIPSLQNGPGEDEEEGFAVDASKMGNFTKFINHSCTPNLYAQNVLYDHDDKSVPHIMFFASEDIPPHQELAYHYNYTVDQVHDVNGNIKKKKCLCGSIECDGWLY